MCIERSFVNVNNLIFSLNATMPVFLMMVLGYILKKINWIDEEFASKINSFVFHVPLPVLVFNDLATVDFMEVWDTKFVVFCFLATLTSILIAFVVSAIWKDKSIQGEFVQASYRSSAAILGIAFIQNIYGNAGMGPLMVVASVPLYNVAAVLILTLLGKEHKKMDKALLIKTLKGITTNPIIIGIVFGFTWSSFRIPMPYIMEKTVTNVANIATPLGLMAMGAAFDWKKAFAKIKPAFIAVTIKLVGFVLIFLPIAIKMGFREEKIVALLVMLGSATTISCYVMAKNMGHEGTLTSSVIMLTTLFCAFTLTGWLFVLRSIGLI